MPLSDRLFVPLAERPYRWFESGLKTWELRTMGRRFNARHIRIGRVVELRRGYSTPDSLWGTVIEGEHGFRASGHRFVILGLCPKCIRARGPRRRLDLV